MYFSSPLGARCSGLLALLLCLAACTPATPPPMPDTTAGISWTLAQYRAATLSDLRYDIALTIPPDRAAPITGTTTLRFTRTDTEGPLVVDFAAPEERVQAVRTAAGPVAFTLDNNHIVVPAEALTAGENAVTIDYVAGDGALNRNDDFLYTLFVPDRAHTALPLLDQPNLKARYRLTLTVPDAWQAVANGPAASASPSDAVAVPEGYRTYRFAETAPLPTYLFAFAAGRFQAETATREGRTMTMYHRETDAEKLARNRDAIFDLHAQALAWLEDYTAIPYPFDKFDFVLIPSFQYGGMEHPGAILYRQASLLLDESATQSQRLGRASLIAHETAHMWFGDLVTMNWFDDVWTKEVFANFMAAKITRPAFPEVNHDLRFLLAHYPAAYAVDRTDGANPIRQPLDNLVEAGTLYGAIIYQKAPIVMRHLERLVGETALRDGLRTYLDRYRYANATWPDLVGILDAAHGDDLRAWSTVWVETPGRPTIHTTLTFDEKIEQLALRQEDPHGAGRRWPQHLDVVLGYPDFPRRFEVALTGETVGIDEAIGEPRPDYVLPQGYGVGYGHFVLDGWSRSYLQDHLHEVDDPVLRGTALVTLWDALLYGRVPPNRFLGYLALRVLPAETDELNAQRMLGYLSAGFWRFLTPDQRTRFAPQLERQLWGLMQRAPTSSRKAAFFNTYRDVVLTESGTERLYAVWAGEAGVPGLSFSERDRTAMAFALALRRPDDATAILDRQAARLTNPDRQARFAFIRPALAPEAALQEAFFASFQDPAQRAHEPWVLEAVRLLNHPLRGDHRRAYLRPGLDLVWEIQRTGDIFFPQRWLGALLGGHQHPEAAAIVRDFLDTLPPAYPPRLEGKVRQSADGLFRAAALTGGTPLPAGG